ncbi:MAG: hypothetical protein IT355_18705 [Gemmatimonadaceae bacterium]|nr:hypothetical protein [Gemmatimonadaceae bacterium]
MANGSGFSLGGIGGRIVAALALVFLTYNPEGKSFYHWALAPLIDGRSSSGPLSVKFLAGLALAAAWVVFLSATRRSLGIGGALLVLAISGGLVWMLMDFGIVSANSARSVTYVVEICTALMLAVGMSWSLMSKKITGQVDVDRTD